MFYNFFTGYTAEVIASQLKKTLSDFEIEDYSLEQIDGLNYSGFYFKSNNDGELFHLGFYLTKYNKEFWKKSPSLHIDFCDNVKKLRHLMRGTNSQYVTYQSKDNTKTYYNEKLTICKKCLSIIRNKTSLNFSGTTFEEFILSLEESEKTKETRVDSKGYVINWRQISKAYREYKKYKCEKCHFHLNDMKFSNYFQTHHINSYDKKNNKRSNLQCLCVKCHSEVDDYHRKQFSSLENQVLLSGFEEYKKQNK